MQQEKNKLNDQWCRLPDELKLSEKITSKNTTNWQNAWRRFKKNKVAMLGVCIVLIIILLSIFGPMYTGYDYSSQNVYLRNIPPYYPVTLLPDNTNVYVHRELKVYLLDADCKLVDLIEPTKQSPETKTYSYQINGFDYNLKFGSSIEFQTATGQSLKPTQTVWNTKNLLGTDSLGRDMLTRLLYGGRVSLVVAFITTIGVLLIGLLYGGIAGYLGGITDIIMMRIVEVIISIPSTIYIILLMVLLGQGVINILIAMAITSWLGMARLVRGQVLSLKEREFICAAKILAVPPLRIIVRHLIPNCLGPIIISATLAIPGAIATEAFMSFIGLGVAPPMPSWGILSSEGIQSLRSAPYQIILPSICISLTMFGFNFMGDGLRDSLDPKLLK